jgi:transaldolase
MRRTSGVGGFSNTFLMNRSGQSMPNRAYLDWVCEHTKTKWWHDSAEADELALGLKRGAIGVTTNPVLANIAINKNRALWGPAIDEVMARNLSAELKAEALMRIAVTNAAAKLMPQYEASKGQSGFVCAQVNPFRAGDRDFMQDMARRFHSWAPNIAVKLPATSAGLDVLEDCIADGITITVTVSFTVPQVVAIAQRHRAGIARAKARQMEPGKCFAVIMIGRLDDYLREVAFDNQASVTEADIRQAGIAVTKRAYGIYKKAGYEAVLLVAALRGSWHLTELAGADVVMSIAPPYQTVLVSQDFAHEERIHLPVAEDVLARLQKMPEFVRSFEPDGMKADEFIGFGATQRTLSQFCEQGWKLMENFQ